MSLIRDDRIAETTTSTGTGVIALAGAISAAFKAFSAACAIGDTFYGVIEGIDVNGVPTGEWEDGLYTYSAASQITRTTVYKSSNAGAAVTFSAGTKRVYISLTSAAIAALTGAAAATPTIKASNIGLYNAASFAVPFPGTPAVGDIAIVHSGSGQTVPTFPAGWTQLFQSAGSNYTNGITVAKVLTAGDITTGSCTIGWAGAYDSFYSCVIITGTTFNAIRDEPGYATAGSASYLTLGTNISNIIQSTDLVVMFASSRCNSTLTVSNFTTLQANVASTNITGFVGKYTGTPGKFGFGETITVGAANNGIQYCVVAIR